MAVGGGSRTLAAHDLLAREPAHVLELAVARRRARPPPSRAMKPSISEAGNGHGCEER